jgi:hypothetical protein
MTARPWNALATLALGTAFAGCRAQYIGSYEAPSPGDSSQPDTESGPDRAPLPDSAIDHDGSDASAGGDVTTDGSGGAPADGASPDGGESSRDGDAAASDRGAADSDRSDGSSDASPVSDRVDATTDLGDALATTDVSRDAVDASDDRIDTCSMATLPEAIAYYSFDDCSDDRIVLRDGTSHMNDAEKRGRVGCVPGHLGSAILLDGEASPKGYVNVPNGPDFRFTDQLTVTLWVSVLNTQYRPILSKWYSPDTFILHADADSFHFAFAVPNPSDPVVAWQSVNLTVPIKLHAWVHLAAVFDKGLARLYRDGIGDSDGGTATAAANVLQNSDRPLQIGAMTDEPATGIPVAETFTGLIDEVRIYNQALTPCQITALASQ